MSSTLEQEEYLDTCLSLFNERMASFAESSEVVDMGKWLWNYTFDVIGELFFGRHFGFMETNVDDQGWMDMLENMLPIMITAGVLPRYMRTAVLLLGLFDPSIRKGVPSFNKLKAACVECVAQRQRQMDQNEPIRRDNLAKALDMYQADLHNEKKSDRQKMLLEDVHNEAFNGIGAGTETTAITLNAILYYLLTHPPCYRALISEIMTADREGRLSRPCVRYSEAVKLPYLNACIKEGMRLHPSIGLTLPRIVPAGGVEIAGTHLPEGYKVGVNAAVVQYDRDVFGEDAETFRPERWLQSGRELARMERTMLVFGAGKRTCIGMNIALVEMYKLIPHFLRDFQVELADPGRGIRTKNIWFHRRDGFLVRLSKRERPEE